MKESIEGTFDDGTEFSAAVELAFVAAKHAWALRSAMSELKPVEVWLVQTDESDGGALLLYAPGEHQQAIIDFVESLGGS